jgi:hypothetical protein
VTVEPVNGQVFRTEYVTEPAASLIHARLKAAMADLADDQNFAEGHELHSETSSKVPKEAIDHSASVKSNRAIKASIWKP